MNILVTGGAGYLGSVLVSRLLEKGYQVTVFDILMFGGEGLLPHVGNKGFSLITGDVRDEKLLKKTFLENTFDAVVHLAALVGEPACSINPNLTWEINHKACVDVAREAEKHSVPRFIFTSTCSNYGVLDPEIFADEDFPLHPLSLYAETKIAAEKEILALTSSTFTPTILRLATIFGLSPKMRFNLLINEIVLDAVYGKQILLYKEEAWRPYSHIEDVARAIIITLKADMSVIKGEIFNVGTQNAQKKTLIEIANKYFSALNMEKKGGYPDNRDYRVSFEKIKRALKFFPKKTIEEGIVEMKNALDNRLFSNPYDKKYNMWLDEGLFN